MHAKGYGTSSIRIQQNHTRNEHGFEEDKHFFKVTGKELKFRRPSFRGLINKYIILLILWS
ncbi:ORF6N domain-containing protein [Pantoea sp. App145]|uniref:ORF6N domain-containing protein n=1 Tax=Pantoea sp. App145 TaxID=3071567 RepID=UPI003A807EAF